MLTADGVAGNRQFAWAGGAMVFALCVQDIDRTLLRLPLAGAGALAGVTLAVGARRFGELISEEVGRRVGAASVALMVLLGALALWRCTPTSLVLLGRWQPRAAASALDLGASYWALIYCGVLGTFGARGLGIAASRCIERG